VIRRDSPLATKGLMFKLPQRRPYNVGVTMTSAQRVIADLRDLAARTSNADGAQRLAWGPIWREARAWFASRVAELGLTIETDSAGNNWVTLPGRLGRRRRRAVRAQPAGLVGRIGQSQPR
jgi:hypothetical protein